MKPIHIVFNCVAIAYNAVVIRYSCILFTAQVYPFKTLENIVEFDSPAEPSFTAEKKNEE
jgi:hypothetical protein